MQRGIHAAISGMILTVMLTGCGGGDEEAMPPAIPTLISIAVTPPGPSIAPLTTTQFRASGEYADGSTVELTSSATWSSSDTGIATVSAHGLATAGTATGIAVITAQYSGKTGSATLTTSEMVSLFVTPPIAPSIAPNMTQQFLAYGTLANSVEQKLTSGVNWTSSDINIATVDTSGLASAVNAPGTVTISATFTGITGSALLTTSPVATISTSPATASIAKGTMQQFTASGMLVDGAPHVLTTLATWSSSVPEVATISNAAGSQGLASSFATGTTLITAAVGSISSPAATLAVTPATLDSLATFPASTNLALGRDLQYSATGMFSDGSTQDMTAAVTWNSSITSVATISNAMGSNGLATSRAVGTTSITAKLGSISSPAATLTVTPPVPVSIVTSPTNTSIALGRSQHYIAIGTLTDASVKEITTSVTWSSSNAAVAVISNGTGSQGLATTKAVGTTLITASSSLVTSNTATLTVTPAVLASIQVTPSSASIRCIVGQTSQFSALGLFTDGTTVDLTNTAAWSSSNADFASVINGVATVLAACGPNQFITTNITAADPVSGITSNTATLTGHFL